MIMKLYYLGYSDIYAYLGGIFSSYVEIWMQTKHIPRYYLS
jgi:hypothetical protein